MIVRAGYVPGGGATRTGDSEPLPKTFSLTENQTDPLESDKGDP